MSLCDVDWQAVATAATGLMAVGAAIIVGAKQNSILHSQYALLRNQVRTDTLRFRHELFDRRISIYNATNSLLLSIVFHASPPSREVETTFLKSLGDATFLCGEPLRLHLQSIWRTVCEYNLAHNQKSASYDRTGDYGHENIAREHALLLEINDLHRNLPNMFHEIRPVAEALEEGRDT